MKKSQAQDSKSTGTLISEKERVKANELSATKRQELLQKGLALIHENGGSAKRNDVRR